MQGISTVVVIILILLITVSFVALGYFFFSGIFTTATKTAGNLTETATAGMTAQMKIESVSGKDIYVRNIGLAELSGFNVYVNDVKVDYTIDKSPLNPGEVAKINLTNAPSGTIRVTAAPIAIATYIAPASPTCPDGTCAVGENCPADASGCPEPAVCRYRTCDNGCNNPAGFIASGSQDDEGSNICNATAGCASPPCVCDGSGNCISSGDIIPPMWSNPQNFTPSTFSSTTRSEFNITWTDNIGISKALTEMNYSGTNNYSMTNSYGGSKYNYSVILPAGTFYWKSYANDTSNNWNSTGKWTFTINKATSTIYLYIDGSRASKTVSQYTIVNYTIQLITPSTGNVELWTNYSDGVYKQWKAGSSPLINLTNMSVVGTWRWTANFTGNQNYTGSTETWYVTVSAVADTTSPAAVTSLSTSSPTSNSITLTWTAPGDDGNVGTASQYDIRYSTSPITDANWASATQCTGEPSPQPAGSGESFVVTGLNPSTTYYFALKTADEVPNWSSLSNVPSGTTSAVEFGFGNEATITSYTNIGSMTSSNYKSSIRFTAQESKTVDKIRLYVSKVGNPIEYTYGIQEDSGGYPSGTYLGSAIYSATVSDFQVVNISDVNIVAGNVYHIVVQPYGTPDGSNYTTIRRSLPHHKLIPYVQIKDDNANTLWYGGSSWSVQNYQPIYILDYTDGTYRGNPYHTYYSRSIYGAYFIGEKFNLLSSATVTNVSVYIYRYGSPLNDLMYTIFDLTDNIVLANESFAANTSVPTTFSWINKTFASPITLTGGHTFRFYLWTIEGNSTNYYRLYNPRTLSTSPYQGLTYDGTNSVETYSSSSGSSWTDYLYNDMNFKFA